MKPPKMFLFVFFVGGLSAAELPADPGRIDVTVSPYYNSSGPVIAVGKFSAGLASSDRATFLATIHDMSASWEDLSFAEMYVAAIRLYDLGYRQDAVYWYNSARYRGRLFARLVDPLRVGGMGAPGFELLTAQDAFYHLVGPTINVYALHDIPAEESLLRAVKKREAFLLPKMNETYPHVALIRRIDWEAANEAVNADLGKFVAFLDQKQSELAQQRIDSGAAAKFAGLTSEAPPEKDRP